MKIKTNNGTMLGDVTINNNNGDTIDKKQNIDHFGGGCWNTNSLEDICGRSGFSILIRILDMTFACKSTM